MLSVLPLLNRKAELRSEAQAEVVVRIRRRVVVVAIRAAAVSGIVVKEEVTEKRGASRGSCPYSSACRSCDTRRGN